MNDMSSMSGVGAGAPAHGSTRDTNPEASLKAPRATIERVDTLLVDVPTIRPHRLSVATMNAQTLVLVRIRFADGVTGLGEATTIGGLAYGGESPESIKTNMDTYFAPLITGMDGARPGLVMAKLRKAIQDNRFAKCAVETALFDAQAQRLGVPLSELFGGRMNHAVEVAWTLASGDTHRDIAEAEHMLEIQRHRIFKLKIGLHPLATDVTHATAIKRALGDRADVRVDVNQAWSTSDAVRGVAMLADAGISLVEQPTARDDRAALARLTGLNRLAIMADEALHGADDAFALARMGAADVFALKIAQSAGLTGAAKVAAIAQSAGIDLYGGTMLEGAVGTMASAQLFSTMGELKWGTELFGPLLLTEEILQEPLRYEGFALHLPDTPGLGIALDWARVERLSRHGIR
jgi:muconate cycloisomerase